MRRIFLISWCLVLTATAGGGVWAAQRAAHRLADRGYTLAVSPSAAVTPLDDEAPLAAGRIVTVDARQGRVTIAQSGVGRFYIEPGTRVFDVQDRSLLVGLTPGDKVRFDVERDGKHYAITYLENAN